jgi:dTDP-4-amino-4,6-dideoxygalactose transaminase
MTDWRVPLVNVVISESEIAAVEEVYRSGWLTMGPRTAGLEGQFAEYVGARHAVAVSSCTAALHLICLAAGIGPGDEVVVPSLTFVATANAIRYTGATPVFADVRSLERPWLSADAVEAAIGERTRAIMGMSYGGHPGEIEDLATLAAERGLLLLEDAAHGLGGRVGGRRLGTFGLAGAFSFFSNKNLPVGEGGMVVTDDDEVAEQARLLRSHGMTSATWERFQGKAMSYDVVGLGFNYRIDEPRAALASARLGRLDEANGRRAEHSEEYRRLLADLDGVLVPMPGGDSVESAHHLFTVVLDDDLDRDAVRSTLADAGIETSIHYPPVHGFSLYRDPALELPETEGYARATITLPLFPELTEEQQGMVVESLRSAIDKAS